MKKILILGTALLCGFLGRVAAQGVEFRDLTFGQALEQARTENKLVFMDCYTSWCGPCKNMLKNVFTLPEAGEFMNRWAIQGGLNIGENPADGLRNALADWVEKTVCSPCFPDIFYYPAGRYSATPVGRRKSMGAFPRTGCKRIGGNDFLCLSQRTLSAG